MQALRARDARLAGEIMQEHDRRTARAILEQLIEGAPLERPGAPLEAM